MKGHKPKAISAKFGLSFLSSFRIDDLIWFFLLSKFNYMCKNCLLKTFIFLDVSGSGYFCMRAVWHNFESWSHFFLLFTYIKQISHQTFLFLFHLRISKQYILRIRCLSTILNCNKRTMLYHFYYCFSSSFLMLNRALNCVQSMIICSLQFLE